MRVCFILSILFVILVLCHTKSLMYFLFLFYSILVLGYFLHTLYYLLLYFLYFTVAVCANFPWGSIELYLIDLIVTVMDFLAYKVFWHIHKTGYISRSGWFTDPARLGGSKTLLRNKSLSL